MNNSRHTPGPWHRSPYSTAVGSLITANGQNIAAALPQVAHRRGDANADLIATSPDLLVALEGLVSANARARTAGDNFYRLGGEYTEDDTEIAEAAAELEDAHASLVIAENEAITIIARAKGE